MEKLNLESARNFAGQEFEKVPELEKRWNSLHSKYMIKAIEELTDNKEIIEKLIPLAWVHDIGKIKQEENHAEASLEILKDFNLDEIEKDCILNHGSSGNPKSKEAKIFRYADGISLFYPEILLFKFWAEAKEETGFEDIQEKFKDLYEKYLEAYKDRPEAIKILKEKFKILIIN